MAKVAAVMDAAAMWMDQRRDCCSAVSIGPSGFVGKVGVGTC